MYQTKIIGDRLYHSLSEGYGEPIELFGAVENGETPMSLVNIALASCVTMCVQGYFKQQHQLTSMQVEVSSSYEEERFCLEIRLDKSITSEEKSAILAYVDTHCRVKKLLRQDLTIGISLVSR